MSRNTGPTRATRELLWGRAGGRCELCDAPLHSRPFSRHHRRRRGMGGTRCAWINDVSNLLLLCGTGTTGCHGRVEINREVAYDAGWLLHHGQHPTAVPVELARGLVYLTADGFYDDQPPQGET